MAYEVVMPYHLHMPSYFLETFTEYPFLKTEEFFEKNKVFWEGCCHEKLPPFNLFDVSPQIVEHEWNNALLCVKRAFY